MHLSVSLEAQAARGRRDASRLLASALLIVQRVIGIQTEPVLVSAGRDEIVGAASGGGLVVVGLSERWRHEGLGETRLVLVQKAQPPTLLVGPRAASRGRRV